VNADRLLAAAAADIDHLLAVIDADDAARLRRHLTVMRAAPQGSARYRAAAEAAARLVQPLLEREPSARYVEAPAIDGGFQAEDLAVILLDGHRMVGPVLRPVRERLLATPMLDAADAAERWGTHAALIRLPGSGGRARLPLFQFAPAAPSDAPEPRPVVLEVNLLLDARRDPWGAADWWLSPNAWIGTGNTPPVRLLGARDEPLLPDLASQLTSEEGI
jgi:hypothetical protein